MKARELTELSDDELARRLADSKTDLFNLRFQMAAGQLEDQSRLGQVRRDIARIFTVLRQRELASEGRGEKS